MLEHAIGGHDVAALHLCARKILVIIKVYHIWLPRQLEIFACLKPMFQLLDQRAGIDFVRCQTILVFKDQVIEA
jgi:hypothetical protein